MHFVYVNCPVLFGTYTLLFIWLILSGLTESQSTGSTDDLLLLKISSGDAVQSRDLKLSRNTLSVLSPRLHLFVNQD